MTFQELGLAQPILQAVAAEGYTIPTPIQAQAIGHLLEGRDLLGCAQTGTGKTAAFALPILHRLTHAGNPPRGSGRRIRVLVLAPTRELASQINQSFQAYGRNTTLRQTVVYGGVGIERQRQILARGVDILVATPGRLLDLSNQNMVDLSKVEILVLDEADRMFDVGFLPDVRRIIAKLPMRRQTIFFSATMPGPVEQLANSVLHKPVRVDIAPDQPTVELIEQSVCLVPREQKTRLLAGLLTARSITRAIVFTRTKHGADKVARQLKQGGIRADAIHGNKSQAARQQALESFKSNRTHVLVATDLAARGIDVEGVSHVFNFDLPHEPEMYVHRIGRTGRAGAVGIAVSFCDAEERKHLAAIEKLIRQKLPLERDLPVLPKQNARYDVSNVERTGARPARSAATAKSHHRPHPASTFLGQQKKKYRKPGRATSKALSK